MHVVVSSTSLVMCFGNCLDEYPIPDQDRPSSSSQAKRVARDEQEVVLDSDYSERDEEQEAFGGRFRAGMIAELRSEASSEPAHMDMAPVQTLEDQESLALQLLASRRA